MSIISSVKGAAKVAKAGRVGLVVQKYSPQILTGVGVAGVVASAVFASKATLKLEETIDKHTEDLRKVKAFAHERTADEYSSTDAKKDMAIVYTRMVVDITKLYALPVSLGLVSLGCIIGGQGMQYKRTVASVAAYKSLEQTFNKYRSRVAEELGLDKDTEFARGYTVEEADEEGGLPTITLKMGAKDNVMFFDRNNINWKSSPEYNLMFARCQETFAQQRLDHRGHIFLNEVLDDFNLPRTSAGAVLGWVQSAEGNNKVDFGITDLQTGMAHVFGSGEDETDAIMLDFRGLEMVYGNI